MPCSASAPPVRSAATLSHRYITGRQLPDKAISVLDTACARVAIGQNALPLEIEDITRDISNAENQLRILRHEEATGRDHQAAIAAALLELEQLRQKQQRLTGKLEEEKGAVAEIVALRKRIADSVDPAGKPPEGEDGATTESGGDEGTAGQIGHR